MGSLSSLGVQFTTGLPQPWFKREVGTRDIPWKVGLPKLIFKEAYFHLDRARPKSEMQWMSQPLSVCPVSRGLRPFKTEALDWWWYSGFCQGSPKVFVPVSSETLHFDAKSTDFQHKGGKNHVTGDLFSKTPTSLDHFPAALHFSMKVFFQPLPVVPRFRIIFCSNFPAAGRFFFFSGQLRWYDSWQPGGSIFSMVPPSWKLEANVVLEKSYRKTTPPEV